ncbi:Glycine--tRNA ligase beta subunit [Fundidesulfovibrio magnetotacticus]|uniref:Glycine--tRNA ligase beta subunit n=1 Tax=Fundidesulfovibrio magnetotacticus TaxID=2730080 RepID=A0A6V8LZ31_9BACT|nr:glycine--tRNA ligase subunit beta [Fundidesulfovibrio magnetotacticus]GFK95801.1 Glycine--tRNA ligase beta subunit [Fundidesulfovibrio magnetotacticus]
MPSFLLEIGFEEMPSRFLASLCAELRQGLAGLLEQHKLGFAKVETWATPRRLTALVSELEAVQRREEEVVTGPPVRASYDASGNPTAAALGFAKGQGADFSDVFTVDTPKGQYLAVRKATGGAMALDLLPAICPAALKALNFPKKMHWGSLDYTFGRPIRWIVALLDDQVVPFEVARVASGRATRGHRVMGPGPWELGSADDYFSTLGEKGRVVLDAKARRVSILEQCEKAARAVGGKPVVNERLLEEVCGLVERPLVILGNFDPRYLELPREVLLTSMESHQKSFGVEDASGKLLPHFLTTSGIEPTDVALVRKGWERVLKARLEDARFFWETDLQASLDAWLAKLENVTFLAPLGSMGAKSRRVETLCAWLAAHLAPEMAASLPRAGRICKADLVSEMVGEFADLQGVMGGIYARRKGEKEAVAKAVAGQYLPLGPESPVPADLGGALLAVADKMDTLAGCFGLDMIPTGAADPYALRRQTLGVCRILVEHGLRLDLGELARAAFADYKGVTWKLDPEEARAKLVEFFGSRLKAWLLGRGVRPQVAEAALGAGFTDPWSLEARTAALTRFSKSQGFDQAVLAFKRAANIIRKQASSMELTGQVDKSLLVEPAELALAEALEATAARFETLWADDDYDALFGLLGELRPSVDAFFDNVMVMCEDEGQRRARLNLLRSLVDRLGRLADFSALQV